MVGMLIRFKEERCAIIGDIKKMFHAIKISELDQNTHRFLWRDLDMNKKPNDYAMLSVSFGDKPSAAIAITALRKTAELAEERYPEAANVLKKSVYMDDFVDSFESYRQASKIVQDIDEVLKIGNFKIKNWTISNVDMITKKAEISSYMKNQLTGKFSNIVGDDKGKIKKCNIYKVLGLDWDIDSDCFRFLIGEKKV